QHTVEQWRQHPYNRADQIEPPKQVTNLFGFALGRYTRVTLYIRPIATDEHHVVEAECHHKPHSIFTTGKVEKAFGCYLNKVIDTTDLIKCQRNNDEYRSR